MGERSREGEEQHLLLCSAKMAAAASYLSELCHFLQNYWLNINMSLICKHF